MQITVKTETGAVRNYTFLVASALTLFVESLPEGWTVVEPQEAQAA